MGYDTLKKLHANERATVDGVWDKLIWLLTVLLFAAFYILNVGVLYGSYVLLAITAVALAVSAIKNGWKLSVSVGSYHGFVLLFAAYTLLTALWARTPSDATTKSTTIVEILICMTVFYWHYIQKDSTEQLVKAVMWGAYVVVLYTLMQYGISGIMTAVKNEERFAVEFANINAVAMVAAMAVVINVHFWRRRIHRASIIFALPALLLVGASGSRKALIIVLLGVALLYMLDVRSRSGFMRILKLIGFMLVAVVAVRLVLSLPVFRVAADRMEGMINGLLGTGEVDSSTEKRMMFTEVGWELFLEHPIFGVGMGNAHIYLGERIGEDVYTHNNFVEILSGGGIVGFLIYYFKYIYIAIKLLKAKLQSHSHSVIVLTMLILLLIMDWGVVSYYSKQTYFYLMIFFIHAANLRKGIKSNADQEAA